MSFSDISNKIVADFNVDYDQQSLWIVLASIAFNPIFWNIVARAEYNTHFLTKIAGGAKTGCYLLAITIFSLGIFRDYLYHQALEQQPTSILLSVTYVDIVKPLAVVLFAVGNVLVLTSMYALGVTGTYLGDYFGILMNERVTGFPFNVSNNPMYHGSTLCFLASALWYAKPAGLLVTAFVSLMYSIALKFEEPFTGEIYAKRDRELAAKQK